MVPHRSVFWKSICLACAFFLAGALFGGTLLGFHLIIFHEPAENP